MNRIMQQLPLGITPPNTSTFTNFYGERNHEAINAVRRCAGDRDCGPLYLYGPAGSGKTHLLHAACNTATARGSRPLYITFAASDSLAPEMLGDLELLDLVALDDLQHIAGNRDWEQALFTLFNAVFDADSTLLLGANTSPEHLGIRLPDLRSRIGWSTVYRLEELDDMEKIGALQAQARHRGMELNDEVGRYLLTRVRRDMGSLLEVLNRLDDASLISQRRLTVPFVKEILNF